MLALRGIINAASEGRLLLPSNGAIVLLDCDSGEQSLQISTPQQTPQTDSTKTILSTSDVRTVDADHNEPANGLLVAIPSMPMDVCEISHGIEQHSSNLNVEPKYSEFDLPELSKYDFIYEFLCCAKCINKLDREKHREHSTVCGNDLQRISNGHSYEDRRIQQQQQQECCNGDSGNHAIEKTECQLDNSKSTEQKVTPLYATVIPKGQKKNNKSNAKTEPNMDNCLPNSKCIEEPIAGQSSSDSVRNEFGDKLETTVTSEGPRMNEQSDSPARNDLPDETIDLGGVQLRSSRKTSLDSSCTIGSMDSGFIEMQNKLEANAAKEVNSIEYSTSNTTAPLASPQVTVTGGADGDENAIPNLPCTNSKENIPLKECSTQSRNRRKSYEEFKAIYHNRMTLDSELPFVWEHEPNRLTVCSQTEKIKARRKSYEEFKALVSKKAQKVSKPDVTNKNTKQSSEIVTEVGNNDSNGSNTTAYATVPKKKKEHHETTDTNTLDTKANKCDVLKTTSQRTTAIADNQSKTKNDIYRTNFKIYDKLISYGTIYDIMQKKSDIYKAYRKYDAYMTYGTIYEILQRKSDDYELFRRKRVASEKCINKRASMNSSESIDTIGRTTKDDRSRSITFGAIYEIIQRKQRQKKSNSLPNGICAAIEMTMPFEPIARPAQSDRHNDGCIYDIIQTEQCDVSKMAVNETKRGPPKVINNRFLVEKVNEKELLQMRSNDSDKLVTTSSSNNSPRTHTYTEPGDLSKSNVQKMKKPKKSNRMRRFSQILSYTQHRLQTDQTTTMVGDGDTTINRFDQMPHTINEVPDKCVASTIPIIADDANRLWSDLTAETNPFEAKTKMNKLRKLSAPLPATSDIVQPPKIVPRKLSAPPPPTQPLPSSIAPLAVPNRKKCLANVGVSHKSNKHKQDSLGRIDHAPCGGNKGDNKLATNEPGTITECDSNMRKHVNNTSDDRLTKMVSKGTDARTTTRKAGQPDGKTKSRRLSEFTRGEFLNEKP